MRHIDTVVIGAGHAGLATSRLLTEAGRDHVVLDRGRLAESWRSARWDSLRLLTPNWMSRLPMWSYQGSDSEGFMAAPELVELPGVLRAVLRPASTAVDVRSLRAACRWRLPDHHHRRRLVGQQRRRGSRPAATGARTCHAVASGRLADPYEPLPQPRSTARWRRPRGGRISVRCADRVRTATSGPGRRTRGRRAHAPAEAVPRHGHHVVARANRRLRSDHRRRRRRAASTTRAVSPIDRRSRPSGSRPGLGWPISVSS